MKNNTLVLLFALLLAVVPLVGFAQGGAPFPCQGVDADGNRDCDFDALVTLAQNVINWIIIIAIPIATILFAWAGILYVTAGGNPGNVGKAHEIFKNVLIGFIIVLAAWLVVSTITSALLDPSVGVFNPLGRP